MHILMLALPILAASPAQQSAARAYVPTAAYETRILAGFTIRVSPEARGRVETKGALTLLDAKLREIRRIVPRRALTVLRRAGIWVEWDSKPGGAAEFHPSREWLVANGYNPDKHDGVEINNVHNFIDWSNRTQPMMVLHELAHAYQHLEIGDDSPDVRSAYDAASRSGIYESVSFVTGGKQRAYALANEKEYFAELSECWFGRNDFYPFIRSELRDHDPTGYALMERVWSATIPRADSKRKSP